MALDPETEQRIEEPVSAEAVRETRLTPAEAVQGMRITCRCAATASCGRCSSARTTTRC